MTSASETDEVAYELLIQFFSVTPLIVFSTFIAAALTVASMWDSHPASVLFAWVGVLYVLSSVRLGVYLCFRRQSRLRQLQPHWQMLAVGGSLLAAVVWSWAGFNLLPLEDPLQMAMLLIIIVGMASGSTTTLSPILRASVPFIVLVLLPLALRLLIEPQSWAKFLGMLVLAYMAFLIGTSLQSHRTVKENITMRLASERRERNLRESEKALQISEEKFRMLSEQGSDIIATIDRAGMIDFISRAAEGILGQPALSLTGVSLISFVHPDDRAGLHEAIALLGKHGEETIECELRLKGTGQHWHTFACKLKAAGSSTDQFIVNARDVSEQRELEAQLRQSQKMEAVGTLVGGIAHNFNNSLAAITANLFLARNAAANNAEAIARLDNIENLTQHSSDMIKQLLAFARRSRISRHPFRINDLLSLDSTLAIEAVRQKAELDFNVCSEPLVVEGDITQLQQALINLLINARDAVAGQPQPQITCSLTRFSAGKAFRQHHPDMLHTDFARLSVEDNGCGIAEENLERIFDPFFTTKEVDKGTGLGLAMVYGAVQSHDGVIEVSSRPDKGTRVDIYLPLFNGHPGIAPDIRGDQAAFPRGKGENILVVDDDPALLSATGDLLKSMGYRVVCARDGNEALARFTRSDADFDLLLTDVVMPRMNGAELAARIREIDADVPILFVSGYDRDGEADMPELASGSIVLSKPLPVSELGRILREQLKN